MKNKLINWYKCHILGKHDWTEPEGYEVFYKGYKCKYKQCHNCDNERVQIPISAIFSITYENRMKKTP